MVHDKKKCHEQEGRQDSILQWRGFFSTRLLTNTTAFVDQMTSCCGLSRIYRTNKEGNGKLITCKEGK